MARKWKPTKAQKKLGAKNIGWANKSNTFRAKEVTNNSEYATLRFGNKFVTVTKRVGEYTIQSYAQAVSEAKTKEEMSKINKSFSTYLNENPGQVGVLFENISSNAGIKEMFKKRLKGELNGVMRDKFDYLASMVEEINQDRHGAQLFYDETKRQFTTVANKYKEMNEQGGHLDEFQMQELEEALDVLIQMAEQYTGKEDAHKIKVSNIKKV